MSGRSSTTAGVYSRTNEVAIRAPDNPVWKHSKGNDRYIFNTGSSKGWRIGEKVDLSTGAHWYKSKMIFNMYYKLLSLESPHKYYTPPPEHNKV